ncbi:ubiquitin-conjugating enzyme/RWD-like protein [Phakopsora pachyrhizi]|uniref:Ubiquitin-conjugating enzyme/RWD-like protein n=1 Tax=Phakopsora pachyrhizi TaxID=170000 RepID=A0AAV0BFZ4_PHAPC|nr:ubiquitin-conjugating enzyme/RWD-like protein [Phakopsora pachyrhizi]
MTTPQTLKRINRELVNLQKELPEGVLNAGPKDESNIYEWEGSILGPPGSCYEGGIFEFRISLPPDYPFRPPKVVFKTKIYHPNINAQVLLSISSLLTDPNPHDPLVPEIAQEYTKNRSKFERTAKEWVKLHAKTILTPNTSKTINQSSSLSSTTSTNSSTFSKSQGLDESGSNNIAQSRSSLNESRKRPSTAHSTRTSRTVEQSNSTISNPVGDSDTTRRSKRSRNQVLELD